MRSESMLRVRFEADVTFVALNKQGKPTTMANELSVDDKPRTKEEMWHWRMIESARRTRKTAMARGITPHKEGD